MLDTADVRQTGEYDCGAAALEVLFRWHRVPQPRWVRPMCDPAAGLGPDTVQAAVRSVLGVGVGLPMTPGVLRGFVSANIPVLCPLTLPEVGGHWVVVRGVTAARVYYHDPLAGRKSLPLSAWLEVWYDAADASPYRHWGVTGWPA